MIEKFECTGKWWLPETPEEKISGSLKFIPGKGAFLELDGSFKDIKVRRKMLESKEIIIGVSSKGEEITLHKCFETNIHETHRLVSSTESKTYKTCSFYIELVFIGAHFHKPEDIKFKRISIHYSYLDEWVNISGFDIQHLPDGGNVIKYNLPKSIQATIDENYEISIYFESIGPTRSVVQKEASIKQRTYIEIYSPSNEKSFEEYKKMMYHVQNFLSICIMEPVYPLIIKGKAEVNKKMIEDEEAYYSPVKIFYRQSYIPQSPDTLTLSDMRFPFNVISDKFEFFLKNWFEKAELLKPVYGLYFGTLYNPHMYPEHQFLSLTQALEAYHRRKYGGVYLSKEEYEPTRNVLVNAIPEKIKNDHRNALKDKIKWGYEFSLRKRLNDLFDKHQEILNRFIWNKNFVSEVVETRNYLTHYEEDPIKSVVKGEHFYLLTRNLRILIEICLLSELGFSSEEIQHIFSCTMRYNAGNF